MDDYLDTDEIEAILAEWSEHWAQDDHTKYANAPAAIAEMLGHTEAQVEAVLHDRIERATEAVLSWDD
jgi:hypothetical protein